MVEQLEERLCPATTVGDIGNGIGTIGVIGPLPITLPDFAPDSIQGDSPSTLTFAALTAGAIDPNTGAVLLPSSMTILSQPSGAEASVDPTTGDITYTPGVMFSPPLEPGNTYGSFQFQVSDSLGGISNGATATFNNIISPVSVGQIVTTFAAANAKSMQSVSVDVVPHALVYDGSQVDPSSVILTPEFQYPVYGYGTDSEATGPHHGTATVDGNGVITYTPDLGYVGPDAIVYQIGDTNGYFTHGVVFITVNATTLPRLQADPLGGTMLVVDGTPGADTILVTPGHKHGEVMVTENGVVSGPFRPTSRVVIFGYNGDDNIQVAAGVTIPAWLIGGSGNDTLKAGGGPSVLMGGDGNDTLVAGSARDLLIGGAGADLLIGKGGDILVGGSTIYDNNQQALAAILSTLNSNDDDRQRDRWCPQEHHSHRLVLTSAAILDDNASDLIVNHGKGNLILSSFGDVVVKHEHKHDHDRDDSRSCRR